MSLLKGVVQRCICELMLVYITARIGFMTLVYRVLFLFPSHKAKIINNIRIRTQMPSDSDDITGYSMPVENWQDTVVTWRSWRATCRSIALDLRKTVRQGGPAVDVAVVSQSGTPCRLLDFQRPGRPLVVVFGSCT